eukprot:EW711522.1.p3 GENE.EW711522.1~~EW711522.1.p3  ORF type:complete len:107 (+),score=5.55 EW711522.1:114-434(+)
MSTAITAAQALAHFPRCTISHRSYHRNKMTEEHIPRLDSKNLVITGTGSDLMITVAAHQEGIPVMEKEVPRTESIDGEDRRHNLQRPGSRTDRVKMDERERAPQVR